MARHKDGNWNIPKEECGYSGAQLAVLMDIRDELKKLNSQLACWRFQQMPVDIARIDKRLAKHLPLKTPSKKGKKK